MISDLENIFLNTYNGSKKKLIKSIVIAEAYSSQVIEFPFILLNLRSLLGEIPSSSIVIAMTKKTSASMGSSKAVQQRKKNVITRAAKLGIEASQVVDFLTPSKAYGVDISDIPETQFVELGKAISNCKHVQVKGILSQKEKIKAYALEIQKQQTEMRTAKIEVTEHVSKPIFANQTTGVYGILPHGFYMYFRASYAQVTFSSSFPFVFIETKQEIEVGEEKIAQTKLEEREFEWVPELIDCERKAKSRQDTENYQKMNKILSDDL